MEAKETLSDPSLPRSLQEQWDAIQSEAPDDPKGTPTIAHLELLRAHKSRVKAFLSALSKDQQRAALIGGKGNKRPASKEVERDAAAIENGSQKKTRGEVTPQPAVGHCPPSRDSVAEGLAARLGAKPTYLTLDGSSWIVLAKKWMPTSDDSAFRRHWDAHPTEFHALKLFGKTYYQNRWSQSWGYNYRYSGTVSEAREIAGDDEGAKMVRHLIDKANGLVCGIIPGGSNSPYNGCLQNWYEVDHTIGLHSDDEKDLEEGFPIFSLSWGGPRRFVLKGRSDSPSPYVTKVTDVMLEDGDLIVMGGTCQQTHKHEVPKRRVTKDPPSSARINWTIRAFRPQE